MKKTMSKVFAVVSIAALLTSCSVEKRQYTSGYYVDWHNHKQNSQQNVSIVNEPVSIPVSNAEVSKEKNITAVMDDHEFVVTKSEYIPAIKACVKKNSIRENTHHNKSIEQSVFKNAKDIRSPLKPIINGGDSSKNWAAKLGFILSFFIPEVAIWFCMIGKHSEKRGLAIAGYVVCILSILLQVLVVLALTA